MANNFFNDSNKVYSENLNDGILVGNAFDWTVEASLPTDTDGVFPNSSTIVMAKVADVYATPNTNLSIGSTIENSSGSSQVYRLTVYPNFNRYGGFTFVSLEGDGDVIIAEKGGTSPVRNNLDYANLGNVTELKTLREYDLVVTIPSGGVVTGLGFGFQSSTASANAMISQANVSGLVGDLSSLESGKADTEHTHMTDEVVSESDLPNIGTPEGAKQRRINRNLDLIVGSLSNSITNLVQVQYIESGVKSINNGANVSVQHTVTACPSGYSWLWVQKESFRATQTDVNLNGTTFSYKMYNHSGSNSTACYVIGWLVFYPSTWNI